MGQPQLAHVFTFRMAGLSPSMNRHASLNLSGKDTKMPDPMLLCRVWGGLVFQQVGVITGLKIMRHHGYPGNRCALVHRIIPCSAGCADLRCV